jgi:RNA polymerase sigma factor (TIGR02999 family)
MASEVTLLLNAHREGDENAINDLARIIYPELKAMARRRTSGSGMGATTLVNETFVKLLSGGDVTARDRQQFFALSATIMRRVIVDEVRYATAQKRSGDDVALFEDQVADESQASAEFLIEVDRVLTLLAEEDERLAQAFECRYFAGFSVAETAESLSVSERTAERLWSDARSRIAELMRDSN